MISNIDIFSIIKKSKLPINRNFKPIDEFLEIHFRKYMTSLNAAVLDANRNNLDDSFYEELNKNLHLIQELCDEIIRVYKLTDLANMQEAYKHFHKIMDKVEKYLCTKEISLNRNGIIPNFFRIRVGNEKNFPREELFHIPMDKRQLIKPCRYSIAGYPCLYLGTTIELCWYECDMPNRFSISQFDFDPIDRSKKICLLDFLIDPNELIRSSKIEYINNQNGNALTNDKLLKYIISYPIRTACSLNVIDKDNPFIQEYVIPQMLMLWVRGNCKIDGIAYRTASSIKFSHEINSYNVVFPAKDILDKYCKKLSQMFKISTPIYSDINLMFKKYEVEVKQVREFKTELEYEYFNGYPLYLYKEILSLCETFLLLYDCIISNNYKGLEVLNHIMNTLNLMTYLLDNNRKLFTKVAIKDSRVENIKLSDYMVKKKFEEMMQKYSTKVKPVLFDFWGFANRLSRDINIDQDSFEYICSH